MNLCLYWVDVNWAKKGKGYAEHLILIVDFDKKVFAYYTTYGCHWNSTMDSWIECKRQTDIKEYKNYLVRQGFIQCKENK